MSAVLARLPGFLPSLDAPRSGAWSGVLWRWFAVDAQREPIQSKAMDEGDVADIQASRQGDGQAFARLVRRYQDRVAAHLWRFTRQRSELEELVQESFVQAYFSLRSWRGKAPFEHWLMRIATRVGYRHWKQRSRAKATVTLEPRDWKYIAAPEKQEDAAELLDDLLERLPPRDRLVLTLLYVDGHSVAEVAQLSGWSQTMVKVQAFRARGKLRKVLEQAGWHGGTTTKESST